MSGAIIASLGAAQSGGGSGTVTPGALEWADAFGSVFAHTNLQTITGITVPISIVATISGAGTLHYTLNGVDREYEGAFNASAGDTLAWGIVNITHSAVSGTITVKNGSDSMTVLDAPTYTATGS